MQTTLSRLLETKNIGFLAGICFIFNSISGPAIPYTAANFQNTGWLFTILIYCILTILAGFCNLFLIEAIQQIPGNKYFQGDVEFSTIINFFFGPRMHYISQLVLYAALQSNSIQCLILTAQATDQFLIDIAGRTCGFSLKGFAWICVGGENNQHPSPFGNEMMLFTIGLVVALVIAVPFFFYDLDKSVELAVGAAFLSFTIAITWIYISIQEGLDVKRTPVSTPFSVSYAATVGVVMLNLGCATVIPSWINIKSNRVRTQSVMWSTMAISTFFYAIIGIFFSLAFDSNSSDNALLALVNASKSPMFLSKISVALYAYVMLLPAAPVNFIIAEKNFTQNQIMSKPWAIFFSFIFPIIACVPLQTGNYLFLFLTWTSLTFTAVVNFILPLILYLKCIDFRQEFAKSKILTIHQLKLLSVIHSKSIEIERFLQMQQDQSASILERTEFEKNQYETPQIILSSPSVSHAFLDPTDEGNDNSTSSDKIEDTTILAPHIMAIHSYEKKLQVDEYARISLRPSHSTEYPKVSDVFEEPNLSIQGTNSSNRMQLSIKTTSDMSTPYNLESRFTIVDPVDISIPQSWLEDFDTNTEEMSLRQDLEDNAIPIIRIQSDEHRQDNEEMSPRQGLEDNAIPIIRVQSVEHNQDSLFVPPNEEMDPRQDLEDNAIPIIMIQSDEHHQDNLLVPPNPNTSSDYGSSSMHSSSSARRSSVISSRSAMSSHSRNSLPREKLFKCPPFRAVPKDFFLSPVSFCQVLLGTTTIISITNLAINIFYTATKNHK